MSLCTRRFLAMAFVDVEAERGMLFHGRHVSINRAAAVTLERLAANDVQQHVGEGRGEEDGKRPVDRIVVPSHAACGEAHHDEQHPQPLWKVLPHIEVAARTYDAAP